MESIITTAQGAGAQSICARTEQAGFRPVLRRELLCALRKCRSRLGLSTGDVLVLDTLLSFLPCRDRQTGRERPIDPSCMLIVYASNNTVCDRANGMNERVLRRHVARLCRLGLLARRDSATGKRFPLRSGGRVASAYGLDLTPLLLAADRIQDMASAIEQELEHARMLRAEALTLRAELLRRAEQLSGEVHEFVEGLKTVLRRKTLGPKDIRTMLDRLAEIAREAPCPAPQPCPEPVPDTIISTDPETVNPSAGSGQMVRHVETRKIKTYFTRRDTISAVWNDCRELAAIVPKVPKTEQAYRQAIYDMGVYIGVGQRQLAESLRVLDWKRLLRALDYLASNALRIERPEAYLATLTRHRQMELVGHGQL